MSNYLHFVADVAGIAFPHAFNPYSDRCDVYDFEGAPSTRREMLTKVLRSACDVGTDSLWVGRDLGYRGGRRTGLALTDEIHVDAHLQRWGLTPLNKPIVRGVAKAERTASVVWRMLSQIRAPVFLWNVFPLHPHDAGNSFTNRAHTSKERAAGEEVLCALIELLRPRQIVAIGRDAAESAAKCAGGRHVVEVRHPSYGGMRDFERGLQEAYKLACSDRVLARSD